MEPPSAFLCSIGLKIMKDPVIDPDGNSYEKDEIEKWLSIHNTSPITRNPMTINDLRPNRALKESIENYIKDNDGLGNINNTITELPKLEQETDLSIKLCISENDMYVSIIPPMEGTRTPVDICCVIDTSGSMGVETEVKLDDGTVERNGLSVLDVVKHAVKTVVSSLNSNDRISIVSFSDRAVIQLNSTEMSPAGKAHAHKVIDDLIPCGMTNLWDGVRQGIKTISDSNNERMKFVYVLTDGEPTIVPPRGHIPMIKNLLDNSEVSPCILNTFGFGYKLDSELLYDISKLGKGQYAYIPDAAMVGTVFIHSISNALATVARNVKIVLNHDTEVVTTMDVPSVQYGQSRDIVIELPSKEITSVTLIYDTFKGQQQKQIDCNIINGDFSKSHKIRNDIVNTIKDTIKNTIVNCSVDPINPILELITKIKDSMSESEEDEAIKAYLTDLEGEITLAFSLKYYNRWGKHYLRSIVSAYDAQQCNNFKDPGVQTFGGELFKKIRIEIDDIFNNLPPPKPSCNAIGINSIHNSIHNSNYNIAPMVSMVSYNSQRSVCFAEGCKVLMNDGTEKKVQDIRKYDIVASGAIIQCVTKTIIPEGKMDLVVFEDGLQITPWHPINVNNNWKFPKDVGSIKTIDVNAVYNFVLNEDHTVIVNNVTCVTLGHGFTDDVCVHPFFGTQEVIKALDNLSGYDEGFVNITGITRDNITGLVNGFV